jgi:predicted phosphatase
MYRKDIAAVLRYARNSGYPILKFWYEMFRKAQSRLNKLSLLHTMKIKLEEHRMEGLV